MQLDYGAAVAAGPRGGLTLVALQHADVVERRMTRRSEKSGPVGIDGAVEPEPMHHEGGRGTQSSYLGAPQVIAEVGRFGHDLLQPATSTASTTASASSGSPESVWTLKAFGAVRVDPLHLGAEPETDAAFLQIVAQWIPEAHIEVRVGHVEDQSLVGAQEVDMEHRRQFTGRQLRRFGEEAAGEHFEREVTRRFRES